MAVYITIDEGQELRKKGNWMVTDKNFTKVLILTPDYDLALSVANKKKTNKIYSPLRKGTWTKEDQKRADYELSMGLQCGRL